MTDESHRGDTDTKSSSEAKKTSTESSFVTDGGVGTTRKNEVSVCWQIKGLHFYN